MLVFARFAPPLAEQGCKQPQASLHVSCLPAVFACSVCPFSAAIGEQVLRHYLPSDPSGPSLVYGFMRRLLVPLLVSALVAAHAQLMSPEA